MKRIRKHLAALLSAVLLLGLLPITAAAAGHWADDAVRTLEEIYGSGKFVADDTDMTWDDAADFFTAVGYAVPAEITGTEKMTRSQACDVLLKIYNIPVGNGTDAAIRYLYEKNVISGYKGATVNLGENDPIDKASFAVLTYRVLNFVGGGDGYADEFKKGSVPLSGDEFFCWMYLNVRNCMNINATLDGDLDRADRDKPDTTISKTTWNKWQARLTRAKNAANIKAGGLGLNVDIPLWTENEPAPGGLDGSGKTNLDAAKYIVETYFAAELGKKQIFSDVSPDDWFYDGVMYLLNQGHVVGVGDGRFDLRVAPRAEFAMLLASVDGFDYDRDGGYEGAFAHVVDRGYMEGPGSGETDYWDTLVTREEAIYAAIKCFADSDELADANIAILDRFEDKDDITTGVAGFDYEKAMAFAVSHGLVSGTSASTLAPKEEIKRQEMGVFIYRVLIGLDKTKMHDYEENAAAAAQNLPDEPVIPETEPEPAPTPEPVLAPPTPEPEPVPEQDPIQTPDPEPEPEPDPTPTPEPEPEPEPTPDPEPDPTPAPTPQPEEPEEQGGEPV